MPPANDPPTTYLRFKHGRSTVLLFATVLQPFHDLVTDLLSALSTRYPKGLPSPTLLSSTSSAIPIPTDPSSVRLGVLLDPYAPANGWRELDWDTSDSTRNCMKALGVAENDVVAFAFRNGEEEGQLPFVVEFPVYDEEEEEMEDEVGAEDGMYGGLAVGDSQEEVSDGP